MLSKVLQGLGVKSVGNILVKLADGRIVEKPYGGVWFNILGRPVSVTVLFGDEQDLPILGATSLEQTGFGVEPIAKNLSRFRSFKDKSDLEYICAQNI